MPYRVSNLDTSTDEQLAEGSSRTEEFPTEPAAIARVRELLEDASRNIVLVSRNSRGARRCGSPVRLSPVN